MNNNPYKSKASAIALLKRLFSESKDSDTLSIEEIFRVTKREDIDSVKNMQWLSNKLTALRYYNLVISIYSYEGRKRLDKIQLTLDGKRALGRVATDAAAEGSILSQQTHEAIKKITYDNVIEWISEQKKLHPDATITFEIKYTATYNEN